MASVGHVPGSASGPPERKDALAAKLQGALGVPDAWLLVNDLESPVPKPLKIFLEPGEASQKMKYYAFSRWGMALSMLTQIGEDKARLSLFQLYTRDYLSQVAQAFGEVKVPVGFRAIEYLKREIESFDPIASVADVFSKRTCRVPNELYKVALHKKSWFIYLYLDHRRQWLQKIADAGKKMRLKEEVEKKQTNSDFKLEEPESNLLGIVKYQGKVYPGKTDWKREDTPLKSLTGKDVPRSGLIYKKTSGTDTTKVQVTKTFHGIEGTISMRSIGAKDLIT
jgi:hypothetical protein